MSAQYVKRNLIKCKCARRCEVKLQLQVNLIFHKFLFIYKFCA